MYVRGKVHQMISDEHLILNKLKMLMVCLIAIGLHKHTHLPYTNGKPNINSLETLEGNRINPCRKVTALLWDVEPRWEFF